MEKLREMERTEAQTKISALEQKLLINSGNVWTDASDHDSIHMQQDESRKRSDETQQMNPLMLHKYQPQRQQFPPAKDGKLLFEDKKKKNICPFNPEVEQQRRLVTEQLKSLFKEREGKEAKETAAAQSGSLTPQDWTASSLIERAAADRKNWQQGSALMPLLEEDEENW
ncbi:uncharacterized protein LOC119775814 [Cyprinodon tularosa]|uniref:uncharacterized protein LOC119775814 n=1 Tax=Cyprinodon tularosa TaxID=77115 RepID=UPI0018E21C28|nr:uncharacterized protein LOC119775814 [Cyprinodon tularosa]